MSDSNSIITTPKINLAPESSGQQKRRSNLLFKKFKLKRVKITASQTNEEKTKAELAELPCIDHPFTMISERDELARGFLPHPVPNRRACIQQAYEIATKYPRWTGSSRRSEHGLPRHPELSTLWHPCWPLGMHGSNPPINGGANYVYAEYRDETWPVLDFLNPFTRPIEGWNQKSGLTLDPGYANVPGALIYATMAYVYQFTGHLPRFWEPEPDKDWEDIVDSLYDPQRYESQPYLHTSRARRKLLHECDFYSKARQQREMQPCQ